MTKIEIAREVRRVSREMIELGSRMDYYGGLDSEIVEHGREMLGAGLMAQRWADEIEKTIQPVSNLDELAGIKT